MFLVEASAVHVGQFIKGSYLEALDRHLVKEGSLPVAHLKVVANVTGKLLYGAGLMAAIILPMGLGFVGMCGELALTKGKTKDPVVGRMIGAYIGSLFGCAIACTACSVGAGLMRLSGEKNVGFSMLLLPLQLSLQSASVALGVSKDITTFSLLGKGDFGAAAAVHFGGLGGAV